MGAPCHDKNSQILYYKNIGPLYILLHFISEYVFPSHIHFRPAQAFPMQKEPCISGYLFPLYNVEMSAVLI